MSLLKILRNIFTNNQQDSKWEGSAKYWEQRYLRGGNSGVGSYNNLAKFKANFLNNFVKENHIKSVIEWGCGDGHQLSLASYPQYIGYDVSKQSIKICKKIFKADKSKQFLSCGGNKIEEKKADLSLSLDVLYHLTEDDVFDTYMHRLFNSANKYVIIYSCNDDKQIVNAPHEKHRIFTEWVKKKELKWNLERIIKNIYPYNISNPDNTSWSDFYIYHKI